MLATDNWCIKVAQKVYGPYTQSQMARFAGEGRLSDASLVAPAGGQTWREARHYPVLASFLESKPAPEPKRFGRGGTRAPAVREEGETANFIVIFDTVSGAASRLSQTICDLGPGFRLTENVWSVASTQTALGIKNAIAPLLQPREPVFVIDCTRGRTAWQNFLPETHSRLTKAWVRV